MSRSDTIVFAHPSDELYGSDRILVEVLKQVAPSDAIVWLPDDLVYPERKLTRVLAERGFSTRRMPLPVLRRAYLTPRRMPWLAWRAVKSAIAMLRLGPRLVYLNTTACLPLAPAARLSGARVVVHVHESWGPTERRLLSWLLMFAHEIVVVSAAVREALPARARARARLIHNGLPAPDYEVDPPTAGQELTVLIASRWSKGKGYGTLFDAWDQMDGDGRLLVLGGPPPIGEGVDVPGLVSRMRRAATVEIIGEVEDVGPWLLRANCVVVPSTIRDPLPTIALEAAAHARPVVASRSGGLPEIVEDGVTGLLVEPGDAAALAVALSSLTPEQMRAMGGAAKVRFDRMFSAQRFADAVADLLVVK